MEHMKQPFDSYQRGRDIESYLVKQTCVYTDYTSRNVDFLSNYPNSLYCTSRNVHFLFNYTDSL